ncbi:carbohydrate ABC transporter permease [Ruminiclostridium cellobioparum]|uniref:ABC transporter, permease protein n=2 Tax=Ruminiclostridium cellobioparum TaxID=29355 RepID=S0FFP7_RUMCE|nr:sugar ABC transporter permease [Ruminiclostridium cellobioparum]EMS69462.1 ABC transporter, permease protein [Ruminiclostridium cellobioparum subsp. termitidis CT1112]
MKHRTKIFGNESVGYFFVLPALLFMLAFIGYPIINNIILGFQNVDVMTFNNEVKEFVGIQNYIELFRDDILRAAIPNTLIFTVGSIIFQFVVGFALALFFNQNFTFSKPVRGLLMVAWMIPVTVTALMFKFMFGANGGIINEFLMNLHIISKPVEWLVYSGTAMWAIIIANIWIGIPFNMILITTGLSTIPGDIYESANIDGASRFEKFFFITLPMLKESIQAVLVLGFIYTFKVFDLVYVMTQGGPVNATEMLSTYSYKLSFTEFNFSKGASVANILFLILFVVSLFYLRLVREEEVM